MNSDKVFSYASEDLRNDPVEWNETWTCLTEFDKLLTKRWNQAVDDGLFRYTLNDCIHKTLDLKSPYDPCILPCVAQLNPQRAVKRRKREEFETMNDPFDKDQFNFTKISDKEVLINIKPRKEILAVTRSATDNGHMVLLNVSPIDYGHILFAPRLDDCLPQRITKEALLYAFDLVQLSSQPGFRVSFNSLHAWASINHLHFHGMYCQHQLFGDILRANKNVARSCFLLHKSSPIPGFAFTVPKDASKRCQVAEDIAMVTEHLNSLLIPYNIIINRGKVLQEDGSQSCHWVTRTLLWPRKSTKGLDPAPSFDVACIEVGGHFPIKTKSSYDELSPEKAKRTLQEASLDAENFNKLVVGIETLFLR